ncbi:transcriptional repressor NrdR [archaeon]|jgi:transcriptional repressor NrdR|nr:transcriptional repressor NrdR [archaeon]MBT4023100.1 transcriptional repressor NrdR [archaeon]MBT4272498.1 transcriptional repressor NrdR [archaeon]MBT4460596.1 transcriptional repressor NrdR [archaeon]MBT4857814.1 transcriptional repressor NrdR [archaeon]
MKCPYCGSLKTKVVDKRETEKDKATRRRRECLDCEKRFTTYERIEFISLTVIKKNGNIVPFEREKIIKGIIKACEKRDVSLKDIETIVSDIEFHIKNKSTTNIPSSLIGRMVMSRLKKLDKVSYIRFASVYRDFKDPEEFAEELNKLGKKNG